MNTLLAIFVIALTGYLIGAIKICGVRLGTAGVLLTALVFGHYGVQIDAIVRNIGLVCFVTAVGFMAGPKFFRDFKKNAKNYILLGLVIIVVGAGTAALIIALTGISPELGAGLLTGALTSTPGLAAAQDASGSLADLATTGYAIAYPFGVVGVVLFVQLVPKILKADMAGEREIFTAVETSEARAYKGKTFRPDEFGFAAFCAVIALGIIVGDVKIPLPGGAVFSLGTTGGPLIIALIFGHFAHIGPVDVTVPTQTLKTLREFGLLLFLIGAGVSGGAGFVETLRHNGLRLFLYGAIMTLLPMLVGYFIAAKCMHMRLLNNLGSITGGMTSTPALGTLISVSGTDDVASAYAATYPIALIAVVISAQLIVLLL